MENDLFLVILMSGVCWWYCGGDVVYVICYYENFVC